MYTLTTVKDTIKDLHNLLVIRVPGNIEYTLDDVFTETLQDFLKIKYPKSFMSVDFTDLLEGSLSYSYLDDSRIRLFTVEFSVNKYSPKSFNLKMYYDPKVFDNHDNSVIDTFKDLIKKTNMKLTNSDSTPFLLTDSTNYHKSSGTVLSVITCNRTD